jgi:hypothetical protein
MSWQYADSENKVIFKTNNDGSYESRLATELDTDILPYQPPIDSIESQIQLLEATITPRRLREATLTKDGKTWLTDIDTQIATLRGQL